MKQRHTIKKHKRFRAHAPKHKRFPVPAPKHKRFHAPTEKPHPRFSWKPPEPEKPAVPEPENPAISAEEENPSPAELAELEATAAEVQAPEPDPALKERRARPQDNAYTLYLREIGQTKLL